MWNLLAPVLRWPLQSPVRLVVVIVGAIGLWIVLAAVLGGSDDEAAPSEPTTQTQEATAEPSEPSDSGDATTPPPPKGQPTLDTTVGGTDALDDNPADEDPQGEAAAAQAAATMVTAWATPVTVVEDWHKSLQELVTPSFYLDLGSVDPANVPAVTVIGAPVAVEFDGKKGVFDVPTDQEYIRVYVVWTEGAWRTSDIVPAK